MTDMELRQTATHTTQQFPCNVKDRHCQQGLHITQDIFFQTPHVAQIIQLSPRITSTHANAQAPKSAAKVSNLQFNQAETLFSSIHL